MDTLRKAEQKGWQQRDKKTTKRHKTTTKRCKLTTKKQETATKRQKMTTRDTKLLQSDKPLRNIAPVFRLEVSYLSGFGALNVFGPRGPHLSMSPRLVLTSLSSDLSCSCLWCHYKSDSTRLL